MANVKVRLKDASNNVLHPETDWSVVRNKPSIAKDVSNNEAWYAGADLMINATQTLKLTSATFPVAIKDPRTKNTYMNLESYPIKWSAINGKPSGSYVGSVTVSNAVSKGNLRPGGKVSPGIYFYTGVAGNNLIAFVCNDSEDVWGWYYDINGQKKDLPNNILITGANLVNLAVYNYTFNTKNF